MLPKENLISLVSAVVYFGLTFGAGQLEPSLFFLRVLQSRAHLPFFLSFCVFSRLFIPPGTQTIGEEYVDIQPRSVISQRNPSRRVSLEL